MSYLAGYLRVSRAGVWYEPPLWAPKWLHLLTCTYCHGMRRYGRQQGRRA